MLRRFGALAVGGMGVAGLAGVASARIDRSSGPGYEVWTVTDQQTYDLSDGETLSNVLVDQSAPGARLTIRARNTSGWTVKNVGFVGVGQYGDKEFQFQVSCPSGASGRIEDVWMNGKARGGQSATSLGGIYVRSSHAGHLDVRHTYIEGFGNNACYASAVGKDGGRNGTTTLENCYHRDNTVSQFRIGAPGDRVRNCVGVVDDPKGRRGTYPYFNDQNARGIWGKHFPNQNVENSSFYVSPNDVNPGGAFCARYISGRSHGSDADLDASNCRVNANAPTLTQTTSNAHVSFTNLGHDPTVNVIQGGGVPLSPKMAALGQRQMPPELPTDPASTTA